MDPGGHHGPRRYETWAKRQTSDTRPALIHRIRKERDLRVIRQDGKTADLFDLRGKVWVVNTLALGAPDLSQRSQEVMKRLAEKYAGVADFALVSLVLDPPPADQVVATPPPTSSSNPSCAPAFSRIWKTAAGSMTARSC